MVMRSADDADAIGKRIAELRQEEIDRLNASCGCPYVVRPHHIRVKIHQPGCQHYTAPALAPLQQQRVPDDDWRALKQQAQSVEAAFLRRLHFRVEAARPRLLRIVSPEDPNVRVEVISQRSFWAPKR